MFSKILIANRGEIAVRIMRACREMGISTVAVYSEADKDSLHVALADESFCIGGGEVGSSYLNEAQIINAALVSGAQAIHPGYGFLSENANFSHLCSENDIVFIGPSPENMGRFSNKAELKKIMAEAGISVISGTNAFSMADEAKKAAEGIGYPVMLKACSGGGGRGIRLVEGPEGFEEIFAQASAEAKISFGDESLYLEKLITPARHIELQILADEFGNVVCLGDRDCSLQKRNQKLIEETPSPGVTEKQREELIKGAIAAVKQIQYIGVGTLEYLMDADGNFWFMEMNIRLQVEHCVTEMLTGIDIVKWQIRIASGIPLRFTQYDIRMTGTAIECRINACDCGEIKMIHVPGGPDIRFDTALAVGYRQSPFYDSLIGKIIVYSNTREDAIRKLRAALCELVVDGIQTNVEEQLEIVGEPPFVSGNYFIGER